MQKSEQNRRRIGDIVTLKCIQCRRVLQGTSTKTHHCHTPPKKDYRYRPYKKQPLQYNNKRNL